MLIGIDFDNTIACYDDVFCAAARDMGLLDRDELSKSQVKAALRAGPHGEEGWQRLQGRVYGYYMPLARPYPGIGQFVGQARRLGHRLSIISHKTRFGHFDPDRIELPAAAMAWMRAQGFFSADGLGFAETDAGFFPTREQKIAEIARQGCDLFIDDLEEVLTDPAFPPATRRLLFAPQGAVGGLDAFPDWASIAKAVLA
jgi:hypothetical protein